MDISAGDGISNPVKFDLAVGIYVQRLRAIRQKCVNIGHAVVRGPRSKLVKQFHHRDRAVFDDHLIAMPLYFGIGHLVGEDGQEPIIPFLNTSKSISPLTKSALDASGLV